MLMFNLCDDNDNKENSTQEVIEETVSEETVSEETVNEETVNEETVNEECACEGDGEKTPCEENENSAQAVSEADSREETVNALGYNEPSKPACEEKKNDKANEFAARLKGELKKVCASKCMITATVAYIVAAVLGTVYVLFYGSLFGDFIENYTGFLNGLKTGYHFTPYVQSVETAPYINLIIYLPVIAVYVLTAFALCHIVAQGLKNEDKPIKTFGASVFSVYAIIGIVFCGIALLICALFAVLGGIATVVSLDEPVIYGFIMMFVAVIAIIFILSLLYYIFVVTSIGSGKKALLSGKPVAKGSAYVGVVLIISGASNALSFFGLSLFGGIVLGGMFAAKFVVLPYVALFVCLLLTILASAVSNFCFGFTMFDYRRRMKALKAEFSEK